MNIQGLLDALPESYSDVDRELILRAFRVAENAHVSQARASGEPYVTHCVAVADILASLKVPPEVVAAGLLHDVVEDTEITLDDLKRDFGPDITRLVDGVTKLTELPRVSRGDQQISEIEKEVAEKERAARRGLPNPEEEELAFTRRRDFDAVNETLRKTFLAMGDDPIVPLIKLADRLHNMRTLGFMPEDKQRRIAQQTLDIFAPLASILGIWSIKWELEDLAFRYVNPDRYREIAGKLEAKRSIREKQMEVITAKLRRLTIEAGISADISGRPKHIFSIYTKMSRKGVTFEQVHDVRGVRVIVPDKASCYAALGAIHSRWRPIPGEFDDYIAAPKDNLYRSIHTAVIYEDGKTLEVQIRTPEMHQEAEFGIAAHWRYKEGNEQDINFQERVNWLRKIMDWRQDVEDASEFVEVMKSEVFQDRVYVFTPRGDVIDLPAGSTPIDFAYYIHTDVGHRCRGAKVNGKLVSLDYILQTGDQVQILPAKRGGPSRDWLNPNLNMVASTRARSKIRYWFKHQDREQNIASGKGMLDKELRRLDMQETGIEELAKGFNFRSIDDFYAAIGNGDLPIGKVINLLQLPADWDFKIPEVQSTRKDTLEDIEVLGVKGLLVNFGKCCKPAPGDEIIGYITRGRGATIHRTDCPNILNVRDPERLVRVSWGKKRSTYPVSVQIDAYDRDGLAQEVFAIISREKINVAKVGVNTNNGDAVFELILEVSDVPQLSRVLNRILKLPNVHDARRITPG